MNRKNNFRYNHYITFFKWNISNKRNTYILWCCVVEEVKLAENNFVVFFQIVDSSKIKPSFNIPKKKYKNFYFDPANKRTKVSTFVIFFKHFIHLETCTSFIWKKTCIVHKKAPYISTKICLKKKILQRRRKTSTLVVFLKQIINLAKPSFMTEKKTNICYILQTIDSSEIKPLFNKPRNKYKNTLIWQTEEQK